MDGVQGADPKWPRPLAAASVAVLGLSTLFLVARVGPGGMTHGSASTLGGAVAVGAGLGLLVAGFVVALVRPAGGGPSTAAGIAGLAWLAPEWVGWQGGPPVVRSVAMVIEPLFAAAVLHLVLATATGRLPALVVRRATAGAYAIAGVVSVGRALLRDPFLDPACWANCRDNVFLVSSQPQVARHLDAALLLLAVVVGVALVLVAGTSLVGTSGAGRRSWGVVLAPAMLLGLALGAHGVAHLGGRLDRPGDPLSAALFVARGTATAALAAGVLWVAQRAWRSRAALTRLVADLGSVPAPGSLQFALASATGDPTLEVVYRPSEGGVPVDALGRPAAVPQPSSRRTVTTIVRGKAEVAEIVHDPAAVGTAELREAFGPAARLAIDNERLQAELLAQLAALQVSRARVVEAGDRERRNLERNLHDGAQQRLLALSFDLRLAQRKAEALGEPTMDALTAAHTSSLAAIAALRELAHGIYPAILTESGIGPALQTLGDDAPVVVEFGPIPQRRFPPTTERTAYLVVADSIAATHAAGHDHLSVTMGEHDHLLIIEVVGVDGGMTSYLEDRVGALGGQLTVEDGTLRAEIPCA